MEKYIFGDSPLSINKEWNFGFERGNLSFFGRSNTIGRQVTGLRTTKLGDFIVF